jgi:hypothetical protein
MQVKPNLLRGGRESVDSIRSKGTLKSVESRSTSLKSGGGGGTSRKAYERYIGSSGGGSVSSFDGGSSTHRGGSNNSSVRSRPSSAPVTTTSTNNNNSRGGINTMDSMDSTDNSTIASASVDYGGDQLSNPLLSNEGSIIVDGTVGVGDMARRIGVESLATVREVSGSSFCSMSTIPVSNCQKKMEEVESDDVKGGSSNDAAPDAAGDDCNKAAPTPILRQPHHHETKSATKDEDDGHSKSVRFDLSPLERQKKLDEGVVASKKAARRVAQNDVVTSASAVTASTTLTLPLSAHTDQSFNGGDEALSSLQKSSTSPTENDRTDDDSKPRMSDEASQDIDVAVDEEEHDEEFAMFMNGLRREVAGDHTKVRHRCTYTLLLHVMEFICDFLPHMFSFLIQ